MEPLSIAEFGLESDDTRISSLLMTPSTQDKRKTCSKDGTGTNFKFQFDPSIHSTTNWTQSQRYGQYFDILCENGSATTYVVCKTCRVRFAKRSTESLKSHATEHGFNLGTKEEVVDEHQQQMEQGRKKGGKKVHSEFKFDPNIHSTAEWVQSAVYGQHFKILLENGRPTDCVLCKICRIRFNKRSTDSMRFHLAKHREKCEVDTKSAMDASLAKFIAYTGQPATLVENASFLDFLRHFELHCHQRRELGESVDPTFVLPPASQMNERHSQIVNQGFYQLSRSLYHHHNQQH
uniref:BED-type domain-containing protein n=1 Tax=Globodera pallida TaxID=36090 RepID=A0A183CGE5_GLOPA